MTAPSADPEGGVIAIFGPTGVGKTAVAVELAERLRARGEDPLAISCDSIQIYRGLEIISGAVDALGQNRLEHRLIGIAEPREEFSAGAFAALADAEVARALAEGRTPMLVGGTGLYMRAALAELELRPPVEQPVRAEVEAELADRGPAALHAELPADVAARVHPNDRKRIGRATELLRSGQDPPERAQNLWTAALRRPTALAGLVCDTEELELRIAERVDAMAAAGAVEEAQRLLSRPISRTAGAAVGLRAFAEGDLEGVVREQRRLAKRQLTWLRKMPGLELFEVAGDPFDVAPQRTAIAIDGWLVRRVRSGRTGDTPSA